MERQGQGGLEEFCQWPMLRNGVERLQIRSDNIFDVK